MFSGFRFFCKIRKNHLIFFRTTKQSETKKMENKTCISCGKTSLPEAIYCHACGSKKLSLHLAGNATSFSKTAELLTVAGSIISLVGGIIGIVLSDYYRSVYCSNQMITTFLVVSLFGLASFVYSTSGLFLLVKKRLSNSKEAIIER
jgi:hypothetical protein